MNHKLKQIKRLIIKGDYQFTFKAECELEADGLIIEDALDMVDPIVKTNFLDS